MRYPLNVSLTLDHIHCVDEGDGSGNAEPYLWSLFFKIDGSTVQFALRSTPETPFLLSLQGMVTVDRRNGGHRNLRNTDDNPVDAGEDVAIPPGLGRWDTVLTPIPIADSAKPFANGEVDLPGTIGVVCILMEEDNLSDSSALAGYNAFCSTFESKMNERINSLTAARLSALDTPEGREEDRLFQEGLAQAIRDAIGSAIEDDLSVLWAAWNWLAGPDQTLGSGSFVFDHDDLVERDQIALEARWKEGVSVDWSTDVFVDGPGRFIESGGEWKIYGHVASVPLPADSSGFGPIITFSQDEMAMRDFTMRAEVASREGFVGGFPNFHTATYGRSHVGGTILLKPGCSVWRDVPLAELGNPPLTDFVARFKATNVYAKDKAFVGGFPNFFHDEKLHLVSEVFGVTSGARTRNERIVVCGTVLIKPGCGEWRDVPLSDLKNPALSDIGARFRATHDYAREHGFAGGFPDFFHADHGNGIVCGTVLLTAAAAEWRDVLLWLGPA